MNKLLKLLTTHKTLIFLLGVVLFSFLYFFYIKNKAFKYTNPVTDVQLKNKLEQNKKIRNSHNKHLNKDRSRAHSKPKKLNNENAKSLKFSYKDEIQKVKNLSKNFPQSKANLLTLINRTDPFKEKNKAPKPHTMDALTQRRIGAIKVFALNTLVTKETNNNTLKKDLIFILNNAQDPTITHIAQALLESNQLGWSYFDNFTNAISIEMPE